MARRDSLLYDRRLQVKLHPRSDRGPHHGDDHVNVCRLMEGRTVRRFERGDESFLPTRTRQHPCNDVGEVEKRRRQEHFLHALVGAFYHQ